MKSSVPYIWRRWFTTSRYVLIVHFFDLGVFNDGVGFSYKRALRSVASEAFLKNSSDHTSAP